MDAVVEKIIPTLTKLREAYGAKWSAIDAVNTAEREAVELLDSLGLRKRTWSCGHKDNPMIDHITPIKDGTKCIFCGISCHDNDIY
jgi:hypothetical protein